MSRVSVRVAVDRVGEKTQHTEQEHTEREGADVIWQSKLEWEYDIDDMAFLKFVYSIF